MLFPLHVIPAIESGAVTLAFRRWARARARPGAVHRLNAESAIEILAVDLVAPASVTAVDAKRAGYESVAALLDDAKQHGGPLRPGERLHRIEFRRVRQRDPRALLAADGTLTDDDRRSIALRLRAMTERNTRGVSFEDLLRLVAAHPRVPASRLAARAGRPLREFKADVRKLKALGLTVSHEVGYEVSPRGLAYLRETQPDST